MNVECHCCHQKGHYAINCLKKLQDNLQRDKANATILNPEIGNHLNHMGTQIKSVLGIDTNSGVVSATSLFDNLIYKENLLNVNVLVRGDNTPHFGAREDGKPLLKPMKPFTP